MYSNIGLSFCETVPLSQTLELSCQVKEMDAKMQQNKINKKQSRKYVLKILREKKFPVVKKILKIFNFSKKILQQYLSFAL